MGLSASQGRMLLLTARRSDLEFRAQQISQRRLILSQQLEEISSEYEEATSNRQMKINLYLNGNTSASGDDVTKKTNLTYATLISGTLAQLSSGDSGIVACATTEGQEYSASTAYRLVDSDGAIVVSDESEIPSSVEVSSKEASATYAGTDNVYSVGTRQADAKAGEYTGTPSLYVVAKENSDLAKFLSNDDNKDKDAVGISLDIDHKMVRVSTKDGEEYYDLTSGAKITDENQTDEFSKTNDATLVAKTSKVPKTTVLSQKGIAKPTKGADGKYTLRDDKGQIIARYVVDPTLKTGSTDENGSTDGPNYLQDALRNGKYLLEKYNKNDKKWSSLSWDSASNIYDGYYTEDDDKAKAKYDRLQTQIQNQDKKLELELDNIESQRKAVTTEEESVQKVIDENIEGTFKTFA